MFRKRLWLQGWGWSICTGKGRDQNFLCIPRGRPEFFCTCKGGGDQKKIGSQRSDKHPPPSSLTFIFKEKTSSTLQNLNVENGVLTFTSHCSWVWNRHLLPIQFGPLKHTRARTLMRRSSRSVELLTDNSSISTHCFTCIWCCST